MTKGEKNYIIGELESMRVLFRGDIDKIAEDVTKCNTSFANLSARVDITWKDLQKLWKEYETGRTSFRQDIDELQKRVIELQGDLAEAVPIIRQLQLLTLPQPLSDEVKGTAVELMTLGLDWKRRGYPLDDFNKLLTNIFACLQKGK